MPKKDKPSRIPEFSSIEEEAEFWDTHSTADYENEMKAVKVRVAKNLTQTVAVRLDSDTIEVLREIAHSKGIGPTTMIRMWVMERLQQESRPSLQ